MEWSWIQRKDFLLSGKKNEKELQESIKEERVPFTTLRERDYTRWEL